MFEIVVILWIIFGISYYYKFFHKLSRSRTFDFIGTIILFPLLIIEDSIRSFKKSNLKLIAQRLAAFLSILFNF